jgi:hypothetical protein
MATFRSANSYLLGFSAICPSENESAGFRLVSGLTMKINLYVPLSTPVAVIPRCGSFSEARTIL